MKYHVMLVPDSEGNVSLAFRANVSVLDAEVGVASFTVSRAELTIIHEAITAFLVDEFFEGVRSDRTGAE